MCYLWCELLPEKEKNNIYYYYANIYIYIYIYMYFEKGLQANIIYYIRNNKIENSIELRNNIQ